METTGSPGAGTVTELVIGIPEVFYLYGRGMNAMAGLILFMCLIPVTSNVGFSALV